MFEVKEIGINALAFMPRKLVSNILLKDLS